jgi:hypothetical protein
MAVTFVIALIIFIFFRQEFVNFFKKIDKDHPYFSILSILLVMSYVAWYNQVAILGFVNFIDYNVTKLQLSIAKLVQHLFPKWGAIFVFNLMVRALIFGFLLFFPEHYQKKYSSLVYRAQVLAVRSACYFLLLILVLIFASANL